MFLAIINSNEHFYAIKYMYAEPSIKRTTFIKETDVKYLKLLNKYSFNARNMTIPSIFHSFPATSVIGNKIQKTQSFQMKPNLNLRTFEKHFLQYSE